MAPSSASIEVGATRQLTAMLTYTDASTEDVTSDAVWSSSDEGVATVAAGLVTAVSEGPASVTASHAGLSDTCTVTVTAP